MNEKVQVVYQKVAELRGAIQDLLGTERQVRVHVYLGDYWSPITEEEIKLLSGRLTDAGIESTVESDFKEKVLRVELERDFNMTIQYVPDLETKKRELEAEIVKIDMQLAEQEMSITV